ncbi:MAG: hypothetical protein D9V47_04655 [Clostridia bacterium]|nr:MAG: hypothetical protein D9V47_04655 [Clostridia bacterium]
MLLPADAVIALRCPVCGRVELKSLSLFAFARGRAVELICACGTTIFRLETRDRKQFLARAHCMACEEWHVFECRRRDIWSTEVKELVCEDMGLEIGMVGPYSSVKARLRSQEKSLAEMARDLGFSAYFENADIMCAVLEYLYEMADNGRLTCRCGNRDVEVEIFPGYIQLRCAECGAGGVVAAKDNDDLLRVEQVWGMRLTSRGVHMERRQAGPRDGRRSKK